MSDLNETLVAEWIANEAVAENIIQAAPGGYVFYGDRNDYYIEIKALRIKSTQRLSEPAVDLGYD